VEAAPLSAGPGAQAYEAALQLLAALRAPLEQVTRRNPNVAGQLRSAAGAVMLRLAEGSHRSAEEQAKVYAQAAQSAREVAACLKVASALGYLPEQSSLPVQALAERVRALLVTT
jgi:four helix bundle protein